MEGGGDLIRAETQLAAMRLRRGLLEAVLLGSAVLVGLVALLILLGAVSVLLANEIGWPGSLAIIGGVLLLGALAFGLPIVMKIKKQTGHAPRVDPRIRVEESKEQMADAVNPHVTREQVRPEEAHAQGASHSGMPKDLNEFKQTASEFVSKNPMMAAGGALLVLSLIGPTRALRMAGRGLALASLVSGLMEANKARKEEERHGPMATPPGPSPEHAYAPPKVSHTDDSQAPRSRSANGNADGHRAGHAPRFVVD